MPNKRDVLGRDDLLGCLEHCGLDVRDRRVKDDIVDALASSRSRESRRSAAHAPARLVEGRLSRALGLDDAGKVKILGIATSKKCSS